MDPIPSKLDGDDGKGSARELLIDIHISQKLYISNSLRLKEIYFVCIFWCTSSH